MEYFQEFNSNTYAGSGNQLFFNMSEDEIQTGRVFYKISEGGNFRYSILFSNIIDSTYADGVKSQKNLLCEKWTIHSLRIGKCDRFNSRSDIASLTMCDGNKNSDIVVKDFISLSFSGEKKKTVLPGEVFSSDPVIFGLNKNDYLCIEMTFSGTMIPYHEETLLPVFVKQGTEWKYSKFMPFPGMIGCDRVVKGRIAYFGDSITQGIGTEPNSYLHWNALLSEKIGNEYSYWNLGIGYGRASDASSDGAWLYKAKQNDIVFVCFGVNDILSNQPEEQIKRDLMFIVDALKKEGIKVIIQTIPPFNYQREHIKIWERLNLYIMNELRIRVDFVFDNTRFLGSKEKPSDAIYGGHPDEKGCEIWANELYKELLKQELL